MVLNGGPTEALCRTSYGGIGIKVKVLTTVEKEERKGISLTVIMKLYACLEKFSVPKTETAVKEQAGPL